MKLDEKLVCLRKKKCLTQLELAEAMNVSRQAVSRWESGAAVPSTENIRVLSELYGVPVDYLLNENIEKPALLERVESEKRSAKGKRHKKIALLFAAVAFAVIVAVLVYRAGNGKQMEDISVGALDSETWDDTGAEDFSMDW